MPVWQKLIDMAITVKVAQAKEARARQKQRDVANRSHDERPVLGGLFSKMKNAVAFGVSKILPGHKSAEDDEESDQYLVARSVLNVLTQFAYYLSTPYIKLEKVIALMRKYGQTYKLSPEKLSEVELELKRCQSAPVLPGSKVERQRAKLAAKGKRYGKRGFYILALAVPFLGDKTTLRNLLLTSRGIYNALKGDVFKQVLLRLRIKMSLQTRVQIWSQILDIVNNRTRTNTRKTQ